MIKPSKLPCNTLYLKLEQYPSNTCDTAVLCPLCGQQATPKIYPIYLPQKLEIPYPDKDKSFTHIQSYPSRISTGLEKSKHF